MPHLLAAAGLGGARATYAGDTAMAAETTDLIGHDLLVVGIAATLVNLVLLALFLRSLVAPLLIVATSLLGIAATLGLTAYFTRLVLGEPDVTYYVPLAVGVLLLSLGTDYNLFIVGTDLAGVGRPRYRCGDSRRRPTRGAGDLDRGTGAGGVLRDAGDRADRTLLVLRLRSVRRRADRRVRRADAHDSRVARRLRRDELVARPPPGRAGARVDGAAGPNRL